MESIKNPMRGINRAPKIPSICLQSNNSTASNTMNSQVRHDINWGSPTFKSNDLKKLDKQPNKIKHKKLNSNPFIDNQERKFKEEANS